MSSPYGKVDEHEQILLEAKRKTRKRITIISLSSIVLVGVVFAAVFGTLNNNSKSGNNANSSESVTSSVKAVCDVTLYKDSCYRSLGSAVDSGDVQPEELFKVSIEVALAEVSRAVGHFNEDGGAFKGLNDAKIKEAVRICRDVLDLAVDHLNSSLSTSGESSSLLKVFEDLQTWLSAAGTTKFACPFPSVLMK